MTPIHLLETAPVLGLYVLLAGLYGLAYTLGRLRPNRWTPPAVVVSYGLHCAVVVAVVVWAPLGLGWKALLVASSAAILVIPPLTWRYLEHTHKSERSDHDPERLDDPDRVVARL
jgi:Kef-type K+ transport system membrane component KefB